MDASSSPAKSYVGLGQDGAVSRPGFFFAPQCRTVVQVEKHQHSSGIAEQVPPRNMAEASEVSNLAFFLVCGMEHGIDAGLTAS